MAEFPLDWLCAEAGLFDALGDDLLRAVVQALARLPASRRELAAVAAARESALWASNLASTCRRLHAVMATHMSGLVHEFRERANAVVVPRQTHLADAFTRQAAEEARSKSQVKALRQSVESMAIHCASRGCCFNLQKTFNRRCARKHEAGSRPAPHIAPLAEQALSVSSNAEGDVSFVASRSRRDLSASNAQTFAAAEFRLTRLEANAETAAVALDRNPSYGGLRCSPDGAACSVIFGVPSDNPDAPFSEVCVWRVSESCVDAPLRPPHDVGDAGCRNVQSSWWATHRGKTLLIVLWSSQYYHESGDLVSSYDRDASFGFASYSFHAGAWVVENSTGFFPGRVLSAQPRADGHEVVLVRAAHVSGTQSVLYSPVQLMYGAEDELGLQTHAPTTIPVVHSESLPRPGLPRSDGPFAAAVCPRGECVLAAHRAGRHLYLELLVRGRDCFSSVTSVDATHHITAAEDAETVLYEGDVVPFSIRWSPCARYAMLLDQRPQYGLASVAHSILVLDTKRRHCRGGLRVLPLAEGGTLAPRGVEWTESGLVIQAMHGALALRA